MRWVAALAICLVVSASARADWGPRRNPFDAATVSRYKALLARDPYDAGALRHLVGLYRRYRSVAKLEAEYRAQLADKEEWATLVVLAQLPAPDALALWKRAVAVKPDDARAWIAIGDAARTDAAAARDAYLRASKAAIVVRHKRTALTKLVAAARDAPTIDAAYAELIALSPKDGKLWLDRGNAQLAAKRFDAAKDSFATAEALFRTDPERRLTAITSQGIALEGAGRSDDAIAQYQRALAGVPRGYFLGQELVLRIVDVERKRARLDAAIAWLEQRWPERRRGYFEWALLGDVHAELHHDEPAVAAYRRAVAKAPTEIGTQRKLIALLDKTSPAEALAQHERAARLAPGDAQLQLDLAKRYHPTAPGKALMTLAALARRLHNHAGVRSSIAELYEQWDELALAIGEYAAIAKLEPDEPGHAILLGEAYWRAGKAEEAVEAWKRLETIDTAEALFRHGEVLAMHDQWDDAALAYTKALVHDPTSANTLYGRARAYEALGRFDNAVADARRAVALAGSANLTDGLRDRNLLVRVLGKGDHTALGDAVARWRFAFERGDIGAGYLLAAHHGRIRSHQHHEVLVGLYRHAPEDDALGFAVARSYMHRREFERAREEAQRIAKRKPARAKDVAELVDQIEEERARVEREIRLAEEGRRRANAHSEPPDIVGTDHRFGMRLMIGSDVQETSGALVGFGVYRTHRITTGTAWLWRLDWTRRDDDMLEHNAFALGGLVTRRLVDARRFEIAAGLGPRFELRYGRGIPSAQWDRVALGGDLQLDVIPRGVSGTLGLRFHHSFTDGARSSALLAELSFEVR
jgi:tetratricopeptide (TPR) repeat protein